MFMQQDPDERQLRYFGASLVAVFLIFAGIANWNWGYVWVAYALLAVAIVLGLAFYLIPSKQRAIYNGFQRIVSPLQIVMTFVILAVIYYGVLSPIGLALRLFGADYRSKRTDDDAADQEGYWSDRPEASPTSRYFDTY